MQRYFRVFIQFWALIFLLANSLNAFAEEQGAPNASPQQVDPADCLGCHKDSRTAAIFNTPHGQKGDKNTGFAEAECAVCHGAKLQHPKIDFGPKSKTSVEEQNQVCLGCHERGDRIHWEGSGHQDAQIACTGCHIIHTTHDPVLNKANQTEVCFTCHAEQKAQSYLRSRHPFRDAKMACTDCHNPHGSTSEALLKENTITETCYSCHTEKRGPFLWEHPPVQENCALCHNPHGSTQDRLLKVRAPFLCQQCHSEQFHPSTLYEGSGIPPAGAQSRLLGEGCLNCHYMIHGSNHPAGAAFDR
ncbi:MAG: DmsE family decaheme c-type cytochrome [Gammaproteobacteria bacterium]